ncbi:Kunitz/Bovine pancreatic trypsin inhibitor domain protein [Ancylostoma duodenale]|uniref:Kunitz/Bovine pancreatic trypsin inhibitor domain protein n=1 Tax=Ancylostoma duodenale TaxID=51022 RepID=A0A0C2FUY1_9BILA|nr:Kunitz/Bovine pancreatic trypsin inhibitor domain protein [Ancylostoma duodenale]
MKAVLAFFLVVFCGFYLGTVGSYQQAVSGQQLGLKGQQQLDYGQQQVLDLRYYFDTKEKKCKMFYYDGCSRGANNFMTKEACRNACMRRGSYYST